jgi:hypothetical protein
MWRIKQHEIFLVVVHNLEWETYDSYLRKYLISLHSHVQPPNCRSNAATKGSRTPLMQIVQRGKTDHPPGMHGI